MRAPKRAPGGIRGGAAAEISERIDAAETTASAVKPQARPRWRLTPFTVLRDLCRDSARAWPVSDVPRRVTLMTIWRDACFERLGLDAAAFDAAAAKLVRSGAVVRDGLERGRVYPRPRR